MNVVTSKLALIPNSALRHHAPRHAQEHLRGLRLSRAFRPHHRGRRAVSKSAAAEGTAFHAARQASDFPRHAGWAIASRHLRLQACAPGPRREGQIHRAVSPFQQRGQSGLWMSDLFPSLNAVADEITVIRSMVTESANHTPALFQANTGFRQKIGRASCRERV